MQDHRRAAGKIVVGVFVKYSRIGDAIEYDDFVCAGFGMFYSSYSEAIV